ncbi:MAG TPA: hypothetical protein VJP78_03925, partial [Thermoleophilia bacterium]|nr:hypothetical protein [Thermoleophilia bacterium]
MKQGRGTAGEVTDFRGGRGRLNAQDSSRQIDLDNRVAALLVGENDAHLRALEDLLSCDISLRGNRLMLEGPACEVERGEALVEELLTLLQSGQDLDRATLELAASLSTGRPDWASD